MDPRINQELLMEVPVHNDMSVRQAFKRDTPRKEELRTVEDEERLQHNMKNSKSPIQVYYIIMCSNCKTGEIVDRSVCWCGELLL